MTYFNKEGIMNYLVSASLACADPINIKNDFEKLEKAPIDIYHIDLCDGVFAPTFLLNIAVVKALRPLTTRRLDVHIYGHHPSKVLGEIKKSGADVVIVHVEAQGEDYSHTVHTIRDLGMLAGIAILPTTIIPPNIKEVLPYVSVVVANTVGPAYAGQPFNTAGLQNMKQIHDIAIEMGLSLEMIADGSVSKERIPAFLEAGANHFVLGTSALFFDGKYQENAMAFREVLASAARKFPITF